MPGTQPSPDPVEPLDPMIARLRASRFTSGILCPRCGARRTRRWGTFKGRQRHRCMSCRRTFSDLTGSPAAYIKKLELWPAYADLLRRGTSLREAAAELGIHPSTAFRWRHALLRVLAERDLETLDGWIEIASHRFAPSEKGSRFLDRPARRRGHRPGRRGETQKAHVLVACDRAGHCVTVPTRQSPLPPDRDAFERLLANRLAARPVIIEASGPYGAAARFARQRFGKFLDARPRPVHRRRRSLIHVDTACAYLARFRSWLVRFRGVSTRYLANYLIWHRTIDRSVRLGIEEAALRWPREGGAD